MDTATTAAFDLGGVADITTIGAKTGNPRRIEINFIALDGEHFLTGHPGRPRDWLANLNANPEFTLHLKQGVRADIPVTAQLITEPADREAVLRRILLESWGNPPEKVDHIIDRWVDGAPLVRFSAS